MTTSGTIGQTVIDFATIVDHAFRRAGSSPAEQTPDALMAAQDNLYFYLCQLANDGTNLWTIQKSIYGTVINQDSYLCEAGTIDIRNALYRTVNLPNGGTPASSAGGVAANAFNQNLANACTQTVASGNISYAFPSNNAIANVGINTNGNQSYTLIFEYSFDNASWFQALLLPTQSFNDNQWYYYDITTPVSAPYFRVRETGIGILNVRQVVFNTILNEIEIARINIDQYTNLTNKTFQSRNILQYWYDRQIPQPLMRVWPVSNFSFDQLVVWRKRQIQDVGRNLTNTIEIPDRWIEAVITELARRLILELPKVDVKRYNILKDEADMATKKAQTEERDKSPIQLSPNIACYTRT